MTPRRVLPDPFDRAPFTTRAAVESGLSRSRLRGPDLTAPFRGVRVPTRHPLDLTTRCRALQLRVAGAYFSGATAALLYGAPLPLALERSRTIHVTVQEGRRAPTGKHIRGHAARFERSDLRMLRGVRVSTPARMWCELGAVLDLPDMVAVGDYLIHHRNPLVTRAELAEALTTYQGRRGKQRLRRALALLDDRAESPQESRVRTVLVEAGIRRFKVNHWVTTSIGTRHRIDIVFPKSKLALEYQGDYHRDPDEYRKGVTRRAHLEADGWAVMEIAAEDVNGLLPALVRGRLDA